VARALWRYRLVDITPAFAAEQIIATLPDALLVLDQDGYVRIVNQASCELFRKPESELIGAPIDTISAMFRPAILGALTRSDTPRRYEVSVRTQQNGVRWVSVTASTIRDKDNRTLAVVCIARDITAHKQAEEALRRSEEQLRQAQRLEAMGKIAGAVAHDFDKLLRAITRQNMLLLSGLVKDDRLRGRVEEIKTAAEQATALTRDLLAFSSTQVLSPKPLDLNTLVSSLRGVLHWQIGKGLELVTDLDPSLGWVNADPGQIEQVLLNLASSARNAMTQGGKLTIKTENVKLDAPLAHPHGTVPPGAYAVLSVSDTGDGIDAESQARLFEPFFTPKGRPQETGLGLAMIYGIVRQSGGSITVTSQLGRGTTIKTYLPLIQEVVQVS